MQADAEAFGPPKRVTVAAEVDSRFVESRHVDQSAGQSSHLEHGAKLTRRQHLVWTWQRVIF